MEEKKKREWCWVMKPQSYEMVCDICEGVHSQWCFRANAEMDIWRHILANREEYEPLFDDVAVIGEQNERGYTKHLKDIENLTPERLEEICEESYIDGDSWPGVELIQIEVLDMTT